MSRDFGGSAGGKWRPKQSLVQRVMWRMQQCVRADGAKAPAYGAKRSCSGNERLFAKQAAIMVVICSMFSEVSGHCDVLLGKPAALWDFKDRYGLLLLALVTAVAIWYYNRLPQYRAPRESSSAHIRSVAFAHLGCWPRPMINVFGGHAAC